MSDFLFPEEIPMDTAHTLDQLTGRFRSVKDGLPELVKNSKDQYSRLGILERKNRQIVVLANTEQRRVGVLDFAEAHNEDFNGWTTWSSRTAGRSEMADDIEAGHGNGGKAFMVRGATDTAFLESCFEGRRTRMGFRNDLAQARYKPGHARVNGITLNDVPERNVDLRLREFLKEFGITIDSLPTSAADTYRERCAFTGVLLSRVAEWEGRRKPTVRRLARDIIPETIASHGQTSLTIETCEVWVIVDGRTVTDAPITPIELEPYPGFEGPFEFAIPEQLVDPESGEMVDVARYTNGAAILSLSTSRKQLQMSDETKARNVIRIWNNRNNVATWPLHSLAVLVTSISFIRGELCCPALVGDHLAGAERLHLADTPLVRALREWTRQQVQELAEQLHRAMMAESRPKDREQATVALRSIRDLMRKYLDPDASGDDDEVEQDYGGQDGGDNGRTRRRQGTEYGSRVDEITLEPGRHELALALGSSVPFIFRCLERQDDGSSKPVRSELIVLKSSPKGLVTLTTDGELRGMTAGAGEIWLELEDGSVASNSVSVEVAIADGVDIVGPDEPMLQGQRVKLAVTFRTFAGPRDDLLIDGSIDEPGMGIVGRFGRFTAGLKEGQATVRVRFGPAAGDQNAETIEIGPERMPYTGGGAQGSDIPEILPCGEEAPGMEDYPVEQRTHPGGEEHPTVIEEPQFRNVVWINPNSKEAVRVRRSRGGPSGVGGIATQTFMHFAALKCFDVLKRLYVRQQIRDRSVTETEFIQHAALAEMECADFIDAAWALSDELLGRGSAKDG